MWTAAHEKRGHTLHLWSAAHEKRGHTLHVCVVRYPWEELTLFICGLWLGELAVEELLILLVLSEVIVQSRIRKNRHTLYNGTHVQKQTYCPVMNVYDNVTLHLAGALL